MTDHLTTALDAITDSLTATGELQRQLGGLPDGSHADIAACLERARHALLTAQGNLEAVDDIMARDAIKRQFAGPSAGRS